MHTYCSQRALDATPLYEPISHRLSFCIILCWYTAAEGKFKISYYKNNIELLFIFFTNKNFEATQNNEAIERAREKDKWRGCIVCERRIEQTRGINEYIYIRENNIYPPLGGDCGNFVMEKPHTLATQTMRALFIYYILIFDSKIWMCAPRRVLLDNLQYFSLGRFALRNITHTLSRFLWQARARRRAFMGLLHLLFARADPAGCAFCYLLPPAGWHGRARE